MKSEIFILSLPLATLTAARDTRFFALMTSFFPPQQHAAAAATA
jgi:hypothetical protein